MAIRRKVGGQSEYSSGQGKFRDKDDGQDLIVNTLTREEEAKLIVDLAKTSNSSELSGDNSGDIIVQMLRQNPEFFSSSEDERVGMALSIMDILGSLNDDEARIATALYVRVTECGPLASDGNPIPHFVEAEYRGAVETIVKSERDEAGAFESGETTRLHSLLPLLIAENAKIVCRSINYESQRRNLEKGLWDVDDDISDKGRLALKAIYGIDDQKEKGFYTAFSSSADILQHLSPKRIEELGSGEAVAELCRFWQHVRSSGLSENKVPVGMEALVSIFDPDMQPSLEGMQLVWSCGMHMVDPSSAIVEAMVRTYGASP